jgi:hypothetical protein
VFERGFDLQPRPLARLEAEGIQMIQDPAVGAFVLVHQYERGAAGRAGGAPPAGHALHKRCLARAEIPMQTDQIPGAQELADPRSHPPGLVRAARGEIDRVGVEDGHRLIISSLTRPPAILAQPILFCQLKDGHDESSFL